MTHASRLANALCLAATPTFLTLALLQDDGGMLCGAASPFSGMTVMYLAMGVFHAAPWLKLIRRA
jgi:hypothetical protein